MKKKSFITITLVGLSACLFAQQDVPNPPQPIADQYIVLMKESFAGPLAKTGKKNANREQKVKDNQGQRDQTKAKVKQFRGGKGIKDSDVLSEYEDAAVGFTAKMSKAQADALRADKDVEGVFQDAMVSLGPIALEGTAPPPSAAGYVTCAVSQAGGPGGDGALKATWIWILDTGIDLDHPDLNVLVSMGRTYTGEPLDDQHGHGTHCAGIAAARNNSIGPTGVSPNARVVPVKVLNNSGSGAWSWLLSGINHVAMYDIPGDVVSLSLGAYPVNPCQYNSGLLAITYALQWLGYYGDLVCIAAGNNYCGNADYSYPGCVNYTRIYTVGALNCDLSCASYTNAGPNMEYYAVGTGVWSTYKNGGYAYMSGTSMATPVVAGICHSRGGPPVSGIARTCCGRTKPLARRL